MIHCCILLDILCEPLLPVCRRGSLEGELHLYSTFCWVLYRQVVKYGKFSSTLFVYTCLPPFCIHKWAPERGRVVKDFFFNLHNKMGSSVTYLDVRLRRALVSKLRTITYIILPVYTSQCCRSQWPRGLRRRSAAGRLLRSWVWIPPGAWMFVCCECCVLSGRGLCDELITHPEESYRLCCVIVCDLETSRIGAPYTYDISSLRVNDLTLILLTWRKWWANNASK